MGMIFANAAESTLSAGLGTSDTYLDVIDGTAFPASATDNGDYYYVRIGTDSSSEVMKIDYRSGSRLFFFSGDTPASTWSTGAQVAMMVDSTLLGEFYQRYDTPAVITSLVGVDATAARVIIQDVTVAETMSIAALPNSIDYCEFTLIIRWPSSASGLDITLSSNIREITWVPGTNASTSYTTLSGPANDNIDVYHLFTIDNGTNWFIKQMADGYTLL